MKPRSMHAIIAEILHVCEQRTKRTHVIYKANLSHSMLQGYVELAWQSGLLEELPDRSLLITEKGREYLAHFTRAESMLRMTAVATEEDAGGAPSEESEGRRRNHNQQQRSVSSTTATTTTSQQVVPTYT
ncbi:MAG TPA: winged helix-turn-helix domain-containing protein [Nitrososphaera sp.]|nr:winged helix-turn-helix domain-containing protein [Nitrososphaera sp.]